MKLDHPRMSTSYIFRHKDAIQGTKRRTLPAITWATKANRYLNRAGGCVVTNYEFTFDSSGEFRCVRRSLKNNNNKKLNNRHVQKYDVKVP